MKLSGSVLTAAFNAIDTSGGAGGGIGNDGGNGRFLLGKNAGFLIGSITGSTVTQLAWPLQVNPFVKGAPMTPFIPNLIGGAEGYGVLSGATATDPSLSSIISAAPAYAFGAVVREHLGPSPGYDTDFAGYDALLYINLTSNNMTGVMLGDDPSGLDSSFMQGLLFGGTAATWFGTGPIALNALAPYGVYETLVPAGSNDLVNVSAGGARLSEANFVNGDVAFLAPEPETWTILGGAPFGLMWLRRRRPDPEGHNDQIRFSA